MSEDLSGMTELRVFMPGDLLMTRATAGGLQAWQVDDDGTLVAVDTNDLT